MRQSIIIISIMLISPFYTVAAVAMPNPLATQDGEQCFSDPKAAYTYLQQQEVKAAAAHKFARNNTLVNINKASEAELTALQGIGSSKAQEIILFREAFGDFERVEDLTLVKGIGEKTVAKNRHRLRVQ